MFKRIFILTMTLFAIACTSSAARERDAWRTYRPLAYRPDRALQSGQSERSDTPLVVDNTLQTEGLVSLAERHSPQLLAAYKRWQASVIGIDTATALPDAMLNYAEFLDSIETRLGPIQRRISLDQQIPNPGKLVARQEAAAAQAGAMRANFEATRLGLRETLMSVIADVQELDAKIALMDRLVALVKNVESTVEARVPTGQATQADLLRVQVERIRIESDRASFDLRRPALLENLNALAGYDLPANLSFVALSSQAPTALPERDVLKNAVSNHPALDEELAKIAVEQAKADEAGWAWVPDFSFGLEYQQIGTPDVPMQPRDAGRDAFAVKVGISIPWQLHINSSREDAAEARVEAARHAMNQTRLNLEAKLERAVFVYEDALRLILLYEESVIPKSRQTLELSRTNFTTGKASLTDVLDTERALLAAELSLIGARASLIRGEAQIESLIATELQDLQGR